MLNQNDDLLFTREIQKLKKERLYAIDKKLKTSITKDIRFLEMTLTNETRNCLSYPNRASC